VPRGDQTCAALLDNTPLPRPLSAGANRGEFFCKKTRRATAAFACLPEGAPQTALTQTFDSPPVIGFAPKKVARAPRAARTSETASRAPHPGADCRSLCTRSALPVTRATLRGVSCRFSQEVSSLRQEVTVYDRLRRVRAKSDHADYRARCGIVRHRRCPQSPLAALNAFGLFAAETGGVPFQVRHWCLRQQSTRPMLDVMMVTSRACQLGRHKARAAARRV
jgi:hypothetical protein